METNLIAAGLMAIGAGLAIGLPGIGVGQGQGHAVKGALDAIGRNPEVKSDVTTIMYIGVALTETVALYGLIVAYVLISNMTTLINM